MVLNFVDGRYRFDHCWPESWQIPDPRAAQNFLMPHLWELTRRENAKNIKRQTDPYGKAMKK